MDKRLAALEAVKAAANQLLAQAKSKEDDKGAIAVKSKVDVLMKMWTNLRTATLQRNKHLKDTLELSERFWYDVNGLTSTLKDLQETLYSADPPGVDPETIKEQRDVLEVGRSFSILH